MSAPNIALSLADCFTAEERALVPKLPAAAAMGNVLKYAELGFQIYEELQALRAASVGAQGDTPPLKDVPGPGGEKFTLTIHWNRTA